MREPTLNLSPSPGDEARSTTCYMCACRCGIRVWLSDGRIRYIQGNPAHPVTLLIDQGQPSEVTMSRRRVLAERPVKFAGRQEASAFVESNGTRVPLSR